MVASTSGRCRHASFKSELSLEPGACATVQVAHIRPAQEAQRSHDHGAAVTGAAVEAIPFLCDPITLIAPLDHPWAQRGEIEAHELVNADMIMREQMSGTYEALREALVPHNISMSDLRILITLGNAEAIAMAVQEGIGVGFVSKMVIDRLCAQKVTPVRVRGLDVCREIYIGRNIRRPATTAQAAFWSFLTNPENKPVELT